LRDSIGYLEQVSTAAAGRAITESAVEKYFGIPTRLGVLNIISAILAGNVSLVLDQVNDMVMGSVDAKEILFEVSDAFRNMGVIRIQGDKTKLVDLPDTEVKNLKKLSGQLEVNQIAKLAQLFSEVGKKIEYHINERWIMEATLINCVASLRK
jgi:DNA polymerase III gamma/tau subunit